MKQPTIQDEKNLLNLFKKEEISIKGTKKSFKIGYMKGYTMEKLSELSITYGEKLTDFGKKAVKMKTKLAAKAVSYGVLNGMKIVFFQWFYWRWLYYIKGYNYEQLEPIIELIKKKIPLRAYSKATMLVSYMNITIMAMSKEEYEATQQELSLGKEDKSEKNTDG